MDVEVRVSRLPRPDRLLLAELSGVAGRYGHGTMRDTPRAEAVAALRSVSTDPRLLGIACGHAMVDPHGVQAAMVDLLRQAGADPAVAELAAAELRTRTGRQSGD